jgi:hypothetical protein
MHSKDLVMRKWSGLVACAAMMILGAVSPAVATKQIPAAAQSDTKLLWRLVMEGYYGPYDKAMKCWRTSIDNEALCMRPHRLDRVSIRGTDHLFLVIGGVTLDSEGRPNEAHVDSGALGLLILKVEAGALRLVAKNNLHTPFGTFGNVPAEESFAIREIGPGDTYGWVAKQSWMGQGHLIENAVIFTAIGDKIVSVGDVPVHYDNGGNCENNVVIGSTTPCTDYSADVLFDPADAGARFFPLVMKVTGSREGTTLDSTFRTSFDPSSLKYKPIVGLPEEFANGL